jgi:hypothetical protein
MHPTALDEEYGARFHAMLDRVAAGEIEPIAHLRQILRGHVGSTVDIPTKNTAPKNQAGSFNYVVAVPSTNPTIAVRVSLRGTDPSSLADEMVNALAAHATGASMKPIWFGLVQFGPRDVRAVSCWEWATPFAAHIRGLARTQRRAFALQVEGLLVALSRSCVYIDVKVENMMMIRAKSGNAEPVVIDFDPYFTKRVDPTSVSHRDAARAFVPVAMLLMHCSAGPTAKLFEPSDIARAAETEDAPVSAIAERLGVACDRVCAVFPELECVLMSVLQKYVPFWAKRRIADADTSGLLCTENAEAAEAAEASAALKDAIEGANDGDAIARIAMAGLTGTHVRSLLRLALCGDAEHADALAVFSSSFTAIAATAQFEHMASPGAVSS